MKDFIKNITIKRNNALIMVLLLKLYNDLIMPVCYSAFYNVPMLLMYNNSSPNFLFETLFLVMRNTLGHFQSNNPSNFFSGFKYYR